MLDSDYLFLLVIIFTLQPIIFELLLIAVSRDNRRGTATKWKREMMQVRFGDKNQRSHDFSNFMLLFMTTSLLCIAGANTFFVQMESQLPHE